MDKKKYYASLSIQEKALIIQRELMPDKELATKTAKEVESFFKENPSAEKLRNEMADIIQLQWTSDLNEAFELAKEVAKLEQSQPRGESSAP